MIRLEIGEVGVRNKAIFDLNSWLTSRKIQQLGHTNFDDTLG